jgi:hypothetical protein
MPDEEERAAMSDNRLKVGDGVRVTVDSGPTTGWFVGEVVGFSNEGHVALIEPADGAVRDYLGGQPYRLGSAHWSARVEVVRGTDYLPLPGSETIVRGGRTCPRCRRYVQVGEGRFVTHYVGGALCQESGQEASR